MWYIHIILYSVTHIICRNHNILQYLTNYPLYNILRYRKDTTRCGQVYKYIQCHPLIMLQFFWNYLGNYPFWHNIQFHIVNVAKVFIVGITMKLLEWKCAWSVHVQMRCMGGAVGVA